MDTLESPAETALRPRTVNPAALPNVVAQVRDAACSSLLNHVNRMFASCDDVFFDLAEKAKSNNEQNVFFESMREIRLKKDSVIARFKTQFEQDFNELRSKKSIHHSPKPATADALDLVQAEEMEANVAIASMVTRGRLDCQEQLYHLNRRLDYLLTDITISESNNPLDPQQIGTAFRTAATILDLNIKGRIVLFKHFERVVAKQFHTLIATANQQLINAGVLPKVNHSVRKQPNAQPTAASNSGDSRTDASNTPANAAPAAEFSRQFSELSQLLSSVRELALTGQLGFPLFISQGTGPDLDRDELHAILTELQQKQPSARSATDLLTPQLDLRSLLSQKLVQRERKGQKNKVGKSDEDVINLIAMFFDFVLDDKQLPIQIQALISRLQIPVLKVALKDKSFFSASSHPARRLINEIVAAGIGLSDKESERKTVLVDKLSNIVHDIHDNYEDGDSVFLSGLEILRSFRLREEEKAAKIERRTSEAAKAEAKTKHTKAMIEELVLERLDNVEVPQLIQDFAIKEWQQVLLLARLKHGSESAEWVEALQVLDDLIWTSVKHEDEKSCRRLQRILPALQQRLHKWLASAKPSEDDAVASLKDVLALQESLLTPYTEAQVDRAKLNPTQKQALQTEPRPEKTWKEMTAVERQQVQYQALTYDFIKKAEDMRIGSWVLFSKSSNGESIRCKLAAKIETSDTYIFVNRLGFKVMEKKRKEFAFNMQQGRARLVEHEWFFDRIMNNVAARLQKQVQPVAADAEAI